MTRTYAVNEYQNGGVTFIKNIMYNPYSDYGAIEWAISKTGNVETFGKTLENFGKAVVLSSNSVTNGAVSDKVYINRPSYIVGGYTFEPINVFSSAYVKTPFTYKGTSAGLRGGANTYAELRNVTDTSTLESWSLSVPVGVSVQFVVKNSDGSYNLSKTADLNNSIVAN